MPKLLLGILMFLSPAPALAQSSPGSSMYEPATIIEVKLHPSAANSNPDNALYEVSVKVKQTIYVVITAPPDGSGTIRCAIGRERKFTASASLIRDTFSTPASGAFQTRGCAASSGATTYMRVSQGGTASSRGWVGSRIFRRARCGH